MTSSYCHFSRSTNAVYKIRMRIISVHVPFSKQKTAFNDFTEEFVNKIWEKRYFKVGLESVWFQRILEIKFLKLAIWVYVKF